MATLSVAHDVAARPRQNWILGPVPDGLFIIGAPLLMLALALASLGRLGSGTILAIFVVFNVAHHLPTFIRIYGDVDLFRRFRWNFLLGPLIPFAFAMGVMAFLIRRGDPVDRFFYLLILLTIWDPWHFLMQHYGFMRIYDRPNAAPRPLAARMDLLLCATWFTFIMLAATGWLPEILYTLYCDTNIPLLHYISLVRWDLLVQIALAAALGSTALYAAYLAWCWRKGYFISAAKLALLVVTFGVMYLTYTPNPWIRRLAPEWSFQVGFAVLGMVHVTQYMAIVWRYNRSLATRQDRVRPGLFQKLHARGGWFIAAAYVGLCLLYGRLLTHHFEAAEWLLAILLATGFTSTLMHYYFDGFIWKVRHQQNQEALLRERAEADADAQADPESSSTAPESSWWRWGRQAPALAMLRRQLLYFGLPMAALTAGAVLVWNDPAADHHGPMQRAMGHYQAGHIHLAIREARTAVAAMDRQIQIEQAMLRIEPTSAHHAYLAHLIHDRSYSQEVVIGGFENRRPPEQRMAAHRAQVALAIEELERALALNGPVAHRGRSTMTRADALSTLARWRSELDPPPAPTGT